MAKGMCGEGEEAFLSGGRIQADDTHPTGMLSCKYYSGGSKSWVLPAGAPLYGPKIAQFHAVFRKLW